MKVRDMTGTKQGRLTVIERAGSLKGQAAWRCLCECGKQTVVRGAALRSGETQSCGGHRPKSIPTYCIDCSAPITRYARRCLKCDDKIPRSRPVVHGHAKRKAKLPEYDIWVQIKDRCYNENNHAYKNYGGRGIAMCEEWRNNFQAFYVSIGPRPTPKHTLDRLNNEGNYEPGNVKWATRIEQARNTRKNVNLTIDGITRCVADWATVTGTSPQTIYTRRKAGWDDRTSVFGR